MPPAAPITNLAGGFHFDIGFPTIEVPSSVYRTLFTLFAQLYAAGSPSLRETGGFFDFPMRLGGRTIFWGRKHPSQLLSVAAVPLLVALSFTARSFPIGAP